ncbi:hypothetical protein [Cribrihabitans pelagius]|uniref:hypothetical protein n=1 Tax=Cribrihabitans pelagius TaxID=1765746 RepID=UPI003B5C9A20
MNTFSSGAPVQGPPAPAGQPQRAGARKPGQKHGQAAGRTQGLTGAQAGGNPDAAVQPPRLSPAVLAQIANALRQGGASGPALAAQADLVALHKRIAEMFTTLNEGLGAQTTRKAAADRAALGARLDQLEAAVDRMEGALRIEFEPVLKAALAEALSDAAPAPHRRWRGGLAAALLAAAALAAGAWWHAPLQQAADTAAQSLAAWLGSAG